MIEGSGSYLYLVLMDPDPGGPKTYESPNDRLRIRNTNRNKSIMVPSSLVTYPRCCTRRPACCSDPAFFLHSSQQYRNQCCEAGELNCLMEPEP